MEFVEAIFTEYETYKGAVKMWDLDFRLLSKGGFNSYLSLSTSKKFQVGRTQLNGKIQQLDLCPQGFITIAIPTNINNEFIWLNRKSRGKELLIYSQNGDIDGASFDGFDVFVISIEKEYLYQTLDLLDYRNIKKYFDGDEKQIPLSSTFIKEFYASATNFINDSKNKSINYISNDNLDLFKFDELFLSILKYLELSNHKSIIPTKRKRDIALKKATDIINNETYSMPTISDLCKYSGVSERTLEYAFKDNFKISPKEYIIATKLNKVRNNIKNSSNKLKISNIAIDYGFWHMGRFSANYKKLFGELPSETLKRPLIF